MLILKNRASLVGLVSLEIFISKPNLCLSVYDGNLGDMLTQKPAAFSITSLLL